MSAGFAATSRRKKKKEEIPPVFDFSLDLLLHREVNRVAKKVKTAALTVTN